MEASGVGARGFSQVGEQADATKLKHPWRFYFLEIEIVGTLGQNTVKLFLG